MFCLETSHALLSRLILAKACEDSSFPAEACGITVEGSNKWKTIIENVSHVQTIPYDAISGVTYLSHSCEVKHSPNLV